VQGGFPHQYPSEFQVKRRLSFVGKEKRRGIDDACGFWLAEIGQDTTPLLSHAVMASTNLEKNSELSM
jgi:hypothetical protein